MKIFIIGGTSVSTSDALYDDQVRILNASMKKIGTDLVSAGHDLLLCSPFAGSADLAMVKGIAEILHNTDSRSVEFHCPDSPEVERELIGLADALRLKQFRVYSHPLPTDEHGKGQWSNGWLLAQLSAMDRSQAVVAIGGKVGGSASLLLALAEGQRKPVLPFIFLEGAAGEAFQRRRYELEDVLQENLSALQYATRMIDVGILLESVISHRLSKSLKEVPVRFFLSYPKSRPEEADFVEITLRRRNFEVYRDERDFGAGRPLPGEITESIHRANVFVAIWCREYACSPWCFDELELAIKRGKTLWLLCVDDTRIVPPAARNLLSYPARSREELERHVLTLLEKIKVPARDNEQFETKSDK
jgi:hypothetical protein